MKSNPMIKRLFSGNGNRGVYQRRMYILLWVFGIASMIMLPTFTILMGINENPFTTPMSYIGNQPGMRGRFILWTLTVCSYFSSAVISLIILTKNTHEKRLHRSFFVSTSLLLIANIIPYLPEQWPYMAKLHDDFIKIAIILLAFTLLMLTVTFRNYYPLLFRKAIITLIILYACFFSLFYFLTASWLTQGVAVVGGAVFSFALLFWLYKESNFDVEDVFHTFDLGYAEQEVKRLESRTKKAYEEYLKAGELSRMALTELQELRKKEKAGG